VADALKVSAISLYLGLPFLKNNKPKYVIIEFSEFVKEASSEEEKINVIADKVLSDNLKAFKELAK